MTSTALADLVLDAIATACRLDPATLDERTGLLDIEMDSLSFLSVLTRIEAFCGIELSAAETLELLHAGTIGELIVAIERAIARANLDEITGNAGCGNRQA